METVRPLGRGWLYREHLSVHPFWLAGSIPSEAEQSAVLQQEALDSKRPRRILTAPTMNELETIRAKNLWLTSEVERLKNNCDYLDKKLDEELLKSARLVSEIERLNDSIVLGKAIMPDAEPVE